MHSLELEPLRILCGNGNMLDELIVLFNYYNLVLVHYYWCWLRINSFGGKACSSGLTSIHSNYETIIL